MKLKIKVTDNNKGLRLDKFLSSISEVQTRSRALSLIDAGAVVVGSLKVKPSMLLKGHEEIVIDFPEISNPMELQPLQLALDILFEDDFLIVINKPAGLVVHPAAGHNQDTLVNALVAHSQDFKMKFNNIRPGIVHRLDKDTSGVMVVAKDDQTQNQLSRQFRDRTIDRFYFAVACGLIPQSSGTIQSYLARHTTDRKKFASLKGRDRKIIRDSQSKVGIGKWAQTDFFVQKRHPSGLTLVKLKLQTGRTHQIRVHLSEMGHPILGDETYGGVRKNHLVPRFCLHAAQLGFVHPHTRNQMLFTVDWPQDLKPIVHHWFGDTKFDGETRERP